MKSTTTYDVTIRKNIGVLASETYELPSDLSENELRDKITELVRRDESRGNFLFEPDWDDQTGLTVLSATDSEGVDHIDEIFIEPEGYEFGFTAKQLVQELGKDTIRVSEFAILMLQGMRDAGYDIPDTVIEKALDSDAEDREAMNYGHGEPASSDIQQIKDNLVAKKSGGQKLKNR